GRIINARNPQEIGTAFTDFANDNNLRAMIVSADPVFQDNKDFLVDKANGSNKYMCYPLQIYANTGGAHHPHGHHTLHGPKLATAYYTLGIKAAEVIKSGT